MTTQEFQIKLEAATNIESLHLLRAEAKSPGFVSKIKMKVGTLATSQGWERFEMNVSTLRQIDTRTDTNSLVKVEVPASAKKLWAYAGYNILYYVNDKTNQGNTIEVYVKMTV